MKKLNLSISKIEQMLKSQEIYNKEMRKNIYKELDLIKNNQSDNQLNLIPDNQLNKSKIYYRTENRRKRVKELIGYGKHTQIEIVNILMTEFPEYKKRSHDVLLMNLTKKHCYKSENFKKVTMENLNTKILSFRN